MFNFTFCICNVGYCLASMKYEWVTYLMISFIGQALHFTLDYSNFLHSLNYVWNMKNV